MLDNNLNPDAGNVNGKEYTSFQSEGDDNPKKGAGQTKKSTGKKSAFSEYAQAAMECGYSPIPRRGKPAKGRPAKDAKRPAITGWQEYCARQMRSDELAKIFKRLPDSEISLACGYAGVIWIDRDTDKPEIHAAIDAIIPCSTVARIGSKGRADAYRVEGDLPKSEKWLDPDKQPIVEILADGCNVCIPPSVHPETLKPYRWIGEASIFDTIPDELPVITAEQVARVKEALKPWLRVEKVKPSKKYKTVSTDDLTEQQNKRYRAMADKVLSDRVAGLKAMSGPGGRNRTAYEAVCAVGVFVHHGFLPQATVEADIFKACEANGLVNDNGEKDVKKTIAKGLAASRSDSLPELKDRPGFKTKAGPKQAAPEDRDDHSDDQPGKPSITIEGGDLDQMAITAQDLLISAGVEFYIRGDKLVRPVTETVVDSRGKKTKSAVLVEVDRPYMRGMLCRHIDWLKYDGRMKGLKKVDAPEEVAKLILARRGEWKFPVIAGVISTPTLRYDGSILSKPGYDDRTHLYLESPVKLPAMPDSPTQADAQAALARIKALYVEFPFTSQAGLSVSLSAMLTAVARGMMDVAPAHGWRAPTAGTGKSYSADITSAVVAGTRCPVISAADEAAETEKRIISKAMGGAPIINIDNVNGVLGGDTLCQLISQPICELRILGKTELMRLNNRACVFFNGNNVRVKGDMTRRVLIAELDAQMEKPGEREFKLNPVEMVLKDRGQYIADCLTIIRAYVMAGKPKVAPFPMNSFEDWSGTVRSALIWLGCADPCETIQTARDEDPELQKLGMFIEAAKTTATREQPLLTSEIIKRADDQYDGQYLNEDLNTALRLIADIRGFINARVAGTWLAKMKGRIVDGLRIAMIMDGNKKQPRWFIEEVAA